MDNIQDALEVLEKIGARIPIYIAEPGVLLLDKHKDYSERIINWTVRPDDTWIISYPRSGSTWVTEMVYIAGVNYDFEKAKQPTYIRSPNLEDSIIVHHASGTSKEAVDKIGDVIKRIEEMPSPRFIKTHLPIQFLPKQLLTVKPKMIYVYRNSKDTAISFHHYLRNVVMQDLPLDISCKLFISGNFLYGSHCKHILGFWEKRDQLNIKFISYEAMTKDLKGCIRDITAYLGKQATEEQVNKLADYLSFEKMKKSPYIYHESKTISE